ncbi:hypothetical protein CRYUN_Cryun39dG0035700 [Craigia yunnanensis]
MRGPLGAIIGRYPSSDGTTQIGGIIRHNRKCRDVAFFVIFIAFWVAMIVNSSFGFNQGNPLRLTYGLDYKGNLCGDKHAHPGLRQLELKYWLNPNQVYQSGVKDSQFKLSNARKGDIRLSMDDWIDRNYDYYELLTPEMRNASLQLQGPCYPVIFPSVNVDWSCQFIARASNTSLRHWKQMGGVNINEDIVIDKSIHRSINSLSSVLKRYMVDIGKAWPVLIVCGGLLPLFLSVIWLLMIRHFVAAMPWITVALFNILIITVTIFYYLKAGWIRNDAISPIIGEHDPYIHVFGRELNHLRAVAILMTFVMVVSILTSIAIVRRILMATSVLKVAAKVIGEVEALIIFPFIPYAILAIFYMFWISAALHLFSSGQVVQNNCNTNCCAYDLVSKKPEIPFLPVFASMKWLIQYSLGSVALGSLIVSFVEPIRFILESFRRKLKVAGTTPDSSFGKMGYHTSQGCLRCVQWTIKSVNRNAYIMIAITGKSFCRASAIATELIMNNILRIGRVNLIGDVILFLGKLCVSLSSAVFGFLMLDTHNYRSSHNKISSPLLPVLDSEEHHGTAQHAPLLLIETLNDQNEMQRLTQ